MDEGIRKDVLDRMEAEGAVCHGEARAAVAALFRRAVAAEARLREAGIGADGREERVASIHADFDAAMDYVSQREAVSARTHAVIGCGDPFLGYDAIHGFLGVAGGADEALAMAGRKAPGCHVAVMETPRAEAVTYMPRHAPAGETWEPGDYVPRQRATADGRIEDLPDDWKTGPGLM